MTFFPWVVFFLGSLTVQGQGQDVRLYGKGFSFQVRQPQGWTLDTRSAPQLANFIFYPEGNDWRKAEAVVYVRFVPKEGSETLEEFVMTSDRDFKESCPFGDDPDEAPVPIPAVERFLTRVYNCPGTRSEVDAVTEVPRFFVVFVLSSDVSETSKAASVDAFSEIIRSFKWLEIPSVERPSGPVIPNRGAEIPRSQTEGSP